jgi:hypothetical protein
MAAAVRAAINKTSLVLHAAAALWIGSMLFLANYHPGFYDALLEVVHFVEWLTAGLFVGAGLIRLLAAVKARQLFDLLIALFCIFVGGEEFSWGQRLFGFTPPDVFLEHNTQQELTLHNFADVFGRPKALLILCLIGYAALYLARRSAKSRPWLDRVGASAPHAAIAAWLLAAAGLLLWYPVDLTGEWVEALAGSLFLAAAPVPLGQRMATAAIVGVCAVLLSYVSARVATLSPARLQCARVEAEALVQDILISATSDPDLIRVSAHKRMLSALRAGYLPAQLARYQATRCARETADATARRHRYLIDPWGIAYWMRTRRDGTITVYSFGPDRRRSSDDVSVTVNSP